MMPAEVTAYFLKHQDLRLRLEFQIVCQCAPFLKGMKASSLIALEEGLCLGIREFFEGTQVRWRIFKERESACTALSKRRAGGICEPPRNPQDTWPIGISGDGDGRDAGPSGGTDGYTGP